ncbi:MAG: hypothetical protein QF775_01940, partial [archaeon]|nr:hypothetical protein [archaeon]
GKCDIGVVPAKLPLNFTLGRIFSRVLSSFPINWPHYEGTDYLLRFKHATNPGRVYVFSQLRIPVVADFVPSYCQVIQDGHSGYLVYSVEGWYTAIENLIKSAELRTTMSTNLKSFIDSTCSPEKNAERFLTYIDTLKK